MGYLEALGTVSNPDVAAAFLAGHLTIDDVKAIAGERDAEILKKYMK
ncbi:MAG: hypothetical protein K2O59_01710 [Lachnospiraceae bacterium]|nr:hypothetical protein [Lachnospiraceae bacterium]MDE7176507.1 hypothetical protein [Lachnospiraceae bacterium]